MHSKIDEPKKLKRIIIWNGGSSVYVYNVFRSKKNVFDSSVHKRIRTLLIHNDDELPKNHAS